MAYGLPSGGRDVLRYTDRLIESSKPDNRAVVIASINEVLKISLDQWRITEDPRYLELILRATDRLTKLLRLSEAEGPVVVEGLDTATLVDVVRRDLLELEARLGPGD